ncbi:MAG: phytanoyl-CoA dioxygenase family protein [Pseudomonadota bacterium]|nr:phytanoyl-CoA dioxygenase family protein [Pseudomonadota bacterium]
MNYDLLQSITEHDIQDYEKDGVICIRGQFDQEWINNMFATCMQNDINPGGNRSEFLDECGPGRFVASSNMSRENNAIMNFVLRSPAAEIAGRLMRLSKVYFFYDQLFVKEPGTLAPTPWHNDLPFWPLSGENIASVWVALTPTPKENSGLVYVAGSHLWNKMYYPEPATPRPDYVFDEAKGFERCPMFHKEFSNPKYRFLSWDLDAGDCIVHHPMTVHGSGKNSSLSQNRAAISIRYFGGDATWHGQRTQFQVPGTTDDMFKTGTMPAHETIFPLVWSK